MRSCTCSDDVIDSMRNMLASSVLRGREQVCIQYLAQESNANCTVRKGGTARDAVADLYEDYTPFAAVQGQPRAPRR